MVEDSLIELSDTVYKNNLNQFIMGRNDMEMKMFDQHQTLVSTVQNKYDSDKKLAKLEKTISVLEVILSNTTNTKENKRYTSKLHDSRIKLLDLLES